MTYDSLKKLVWPHTLAPLGVAIAIDYLAVAAAVIKIAALAYFLLQLIALVLGFAIGAALYFNPESAYGDLFRYRIVRFFPLLDAGADFFDYLMTENPDDA